MDNLPIDKVLKYNLYYRGEEVFIGEYESKHIQLLNSVFSGDGKINLFINIEKLPADIISLITFGVNMYLYNLKNKNAGILDYLESGDIVNFQSKKVEYCGIEPMYGEQKIKLKYKENGSFTWIRTNDAYKLSIYNGESTELNVMGKKIKSNKKNGFFILAEMLNLDLKDVNNVIDSKMLVVYKNVKYLKNMLDNIEIKIKDKKHKFTQIFPCKYNEDDLKGNKLKLEEIMIFTSKIDNVLDILGEDKKIDRILFVGEDTYASQVGGTLDIILNKRRIKKVFILNTFGRMGYIYDILSGFDANVYAWTKNAFINNFDVKSVNSILFHHKNFDMLKNKIISTEVMDSGTDEICKKIFILKKKLALLSSDRQQYSNDDFLIASYGLLKIFEKISVPIYQYDDYIEKNQLDRRKVSELLYVLGENVEKNSPHDSRVKILKDILDLALDLNKFLYTVNPKLNFIKKMELEHVDLVICSNYVEKQIIKEYGDFDVICLSDIKSNFSINKTYRKIIFTGIYDVNQFHVGFGCSVVNLLYSTEIFKYNGSVSRYNRDIQIIERENILSTDKVVNLLDKVDIKRFKLEENNKDKVEVENELDEVLEEKIGRKYNVSYYREIDVYDDHFYDFVNLGHITDNLEITGYGSNSNMTELYVEFGKNKCAFFTRFYKAKCVENTEDVKIVEKDVESIKKGDNLIFIYYKNDSQLTSMFRQIICSDKFKSKYYRHYQNMRYWKNSLKNYMNKNQLHESNISTRLLLKDINKSQEDIKQWIHSDKVIGPRERDTYKALAEITGDKHFLENWEDIYNSCNLIRGFRMNFKKKNFKAMVIRSALGINKGELDQIASEFIADMEKYLQVVTVKNISKISIDIPMNRVNCIIDKSTAGKFLNN